MISPGRSKRVNLHRKQRRSTRGGFESACRCWSFSELACQSAGKIRLPRIQPVHLRVKAHPDATRTLTEASAKAKESAGGGGASVIRISTSCSAHAFTNERFPNLLASQSKMT